MTSEHQRVLVVDDEAQITRVLRRSLTSHGYEVQVAADGAAALQVFSDWPPEIVLTDLAMPNVDGLDLCRKLRAVSQVPIIVLSAKGEETAKVEALDAGADDYLTKPFGMDELLARIRAALRRTQAKQIDTSSATVIDVGDFRLDLEVRSVMVKGLPVHLTPKEYDLMVYFASHSGRVLTHRTLLAAVWDEESLEQTEYLRVFIGQLRKKIEPNPASPIYIITDPWIGYRFIPG
jgi:two-component system KDP operon response regulator KdpE